MCVQPSPYITWTPQDPKLQCCSQLDTTKHDAWSARHTFLELLMCDFASSVLLRKLKAAPQVTNECFVPHKGL